MGKLIFQTYQNRPNLEKIFAEGCNNFKPGLISKDLNDIIIESSIIYETVYDDILFKDLYNDMNKIYEKSPHELAQYFPIKSEFYKKLNKINDSYKHLYFYKCDFESSNFYKILKELSDGQIDDDILIEKANDIQNKVSKNTEGAFIWFKENDYFGIMFLNTLKNLGIKTLKHEFLHYFNWAKGNVSNDLIGNSNTYYRDIVLIQKYLNSNFGDKNFNYITNNKEFETLLNDFLNILINIKEKYFKELPNYDVARKFCNDLILKNSSLSSNIISKKDYLKNISKLDYFNDLKNKTSFLMIIFYILIQYRLEIIKHHIFGKFSKFETTYQNILKQMK